MNCIVKVNKKAVKEFKKLSNSIKSQIKKKLNDLSDSQCTGKHLRYCNFWSLRVGDYRIIYEINSNSVIIVLSIKHRKNVYSDFSKLV
jgi:mRNA-degrading endonuclease RelE of RelBE toxin-antitoxin system